MQQPFFIARWKNPCRKNSLSSHAGSAQDGFAAGCPVSFAPGGAPARETRLLLPLLYAVLLGVGMFAPAQGNGGEITRSLCVNRG